MISVVIPFLNEEQLVEQLLDELWKELIKTGENFEVVCVDDGCTDNTLPILIKYR
jgi:glycosyltransferase involved in cell wall biosynthesis